MNQFKTYLSQSTRHREWTTGGAVATLSMVWGTGTSTMRSVETVRKRSTVCTTAAGARGADSSHANGP